MKKMLIMATLSVWLLIGGCLKPGAVDAPSEQGFTADQAIAKAVQDLKRSDFPLKSGQREGIIKGGGPFPGIRVPGTFESTAKKQGDASYVVTLTEHWSAVDFRDGDKSANAELSYYWKYLVSRDAVKAIGEGGDFPPDYVE